MKWAFIVTIIVIISDYFYSHFTDEGAKDRAQLQLLRLEFHPKQLGLVSSSRAHSLIPNAMMSALSENWEMTFLYPSCSGDTFGLK